jgi:1,4-dihydroxy-2-naphthoate octaprenyltransferase
MTQASAATLHRTLWPGIARLADPKVTLASAASLLLGAAAAGRSGALDWGFLLLTVAGIFLIETAKNASGEIVDFDSGADAAVAAADRSPFSGGKRVILDGLLTRRETGMVAAAFYAAAAAAGLGIALLREPRALWLGLAGFACAFCYHASPLRLSYRGFGELAVAFAYGPLVACGTYLVQRGSFADPALAALSIGLGLLVGAFLLANEFPDASADASAGKRTLVVRLGRAGAARLFAAVTAAGFGAVLLAPAVGAPRLVWLGLFGIVPGVAAWRRLARHGAETALVVPAQAEALGAFVLMALGSAAGLVLG